MDEKPYSNKQTKPSKQEIQHNLLPTPPKGVPDNRINNHLQQIPNRKGARGRKTKKPDNHRLIHWGQRKRNWNKE